MAKARRPRRTGGTSPSRGSHRGHQKLTMPKPVNNSGPSATEGPQFAEPAPTPTPAPTGSSSTGTCLICGVPGLGGDGSAAGNSGSGSAPAPGAIGGGDCTHWQFCDGPSPVPGPGAAGGVTLPGAGNPPFWTCFLFLCSPSQVNGGH